MHTITLNKWREQGRKPALPLAQVDVAHLPAKPGSNTAAAFEEAEYRQYLVRRALELMQPDRFRPVRAY